MATVKLWMLAAVLLFCSVVQSCPPEQPALTLGNDEESVTVSFLSSEQCQNPKVLITNLDRGIVTEVLLTSQDTYSKPDLDNYSKTAYFFTAKVTPGERYTWSFIGDYQIGPFSFALRNIAKHGSTKLIVMADMDITAASTETQLALNSMDWRKYDGLIHVGDFAYDMSDDGGRKGDGYFNALWSVIPTVPYLVVAGNHENYDDSRLFNFRWRMPNYSSKYANNFYSAKRGPAWFLFLNYDYLFYFHPEEILQVLSFVEASLKTALADPSIAWRFVVSHRPIFCGKIDTDDCYVNFYILKPFDDLFRKYKVDAFLEAHEHKYERLKLLDPQFVLADSLSSRQSRDGFDAVYVNPVNPLHIISGCAGNSEVFPETVEVNGLSAVQAVFIQCLIELEASPDTLKVKVFKSKDGAVLDSVAILKTADASPSNSKLITLLLALLFIGCITMVYYSMKSGQTFSEDEEARKKRISNGFSEPQDPSSDEA